MDGHAALFTAIMDGQYEMVEFLIEEGANPHLECNYGHTITMAVLRHSFIDP